MIMKNIHDLKQEIGRIENMSRTEINEMKPAQYKRVLKYLSLLRLMVIYLESGPTEVFVKSEIKKNERIITAKMQLFDESDYEKLTKKEVSKLKAAHEKTYDIKKMRQHVRNLRILLK